MDFLLQIPASSEKDDEKNSRLSEAVQYRGHCAGNYEQVQGVTSWVKKVA